MRRATGGSKTAAHKSRAVATGPVALLTQAARDRDFDAGDRPLSLKLYRRILSYAGRYRTNLVLVLVCVVIRAVQLPLLGLAFASVINGPLRRGSLRGLLLGAGGYSVLALVTQFTFFNRARLGLLLGESLTHDIRGDIFEQLQRLTMGFFNRTRLGRIISRVTSDSEAVRLGVQDAVFVSMVCALQLIIALGLMAYSDRGLFLVVIATAPVYYATYQYFKLRLTRVHREVQESYSRLTSTLAESVNGVRVTQGFVREDQNMRLWSGLVIDHAEYNLAVSRAAGSFTPAIELLNVLLTCLLFMVGGWHILRGIAPGLSATSSATAQVGVDHLILFFFLVGNVLEPIAGIGNMYTVAVAAMAGAERIFDLLDRKPDFVDASDAVDLPHIDGRIEFEHLSFSYEPGKPVLRDINFVAHPGQTIALVGHTGSGKSSIINLIARFYLPNSGKLLIDGHDVRTIRGESLHRQTGIVLQQNFLFTGTVLDNIRIGDVRASDQQAIEAARRLDILDLLEALPDGLQTVVGEKGVGLSLGQRQLVCFARAMLADPRIMILDEATSSVDTLTEARIQKALEILLKGRTSFVVAHRLSTIRSADLILMLDEGQIVERGSHFDLLAEGGAYASLYAQFLSTIEG